MAGFIEPDRELETLEDPAAALGISMFSGHRAIVHSVEFIEQNRIFDSILARLVKLDLKYEDQCSARYYFDLVRTLRDFNGEFDRVVEVGVYMGGSSTFLAGCIPRFDFDLDMIDLSAPYLRFAYERVRRLFPEAVGRIRLFHGDLPAYVRQVMLKEPGHSNIVHHDGSHNFEQVVKDMASLYYVRESLFAVIAQDTHLRGRVKSMNFVDLALMAVFGQDLKCAPIGTTYAEGDYRTAPNQYAGGYFMPNVPEGLVLPMAANQFHYPHPNSPIEDLFPPEI